MERGKESWGGLTDGRDIPGRVNETEGKSKAY